MKACIIIITLICSDIIINHISCIAAFEERLVIYMKVKRIKYVSVLFLLFLVGSLITAKPCLAASAEVSISTEATDVTVGQSFFVYVVIDSDTLFSNFEANITYDDDILEYKGGASVITGNSGFLKISDMADPEAEDSRKYALEFEAIQVGNCDIAFSGSAMVYDYEEGNPMSVSRSDLTISVKAPVTASTNAKLKSLVISPSTLEPAFDQGVFKYKASVENETQKLIITALPEDGKAKVTIKGNDFLQEGENKVIVTVLAESGDIIEYTIDVFREAASAEENPTEDEEITPIEQQQSLFEVVLIDGIKYVLYSGKYQLLEPGVDVTVPKGYVKTSMKISGVNVTAFYPEGNMESEFLLVYGKKDTGEAGFYLYDRMEKTLQRYQDGGTVIIGDTNVDEMKDALNAKKLQANLNRANIMIILLVVLSGLQIFIIFRLILKLKGYREDDLD